MVINGRTDLASEANTIAESQGRRLPGVMAREERLQGFALTSVEISSAEGAASLGRPMGSYFTLELGKDLLRYSEDFPKAAQAVAELILRCAGRDSFHLVLIAALGNPDITPDAVGSLAASNILVTRHLKHSDPVTFASFCSTALCRTGVLGTTGVESACQVLTLCRELRPELVIAVDALAGADGEKLCRNIQVCSTGIAPGSGVGNDRAALNEETLGVPVVAVGVPTVIDAALFSEDKSLSGMFVTPRGIDSQVRSISRIIGYGINLALHRGLTVGDIDMLVG